MTGFLRQTRTKKQPIAAVWRWLQSAVTEIVARFLDLWDGWTSGETKSALSNAAAAIEDDVVALLLSRVSYGTEAIQRALGACITHSGFWPDRPTVNQDTTIIQRKRIMDLLLDAGACPDGPDLSSPGNTPLVVAASVTKQRAVTLKWLLETGVDLSKPESCSNKTALHFVSG